MTLFNEINSVTETVNNNIVYGSRVDSIFLRKITGLQNVVSWHYVDAITVEDKEIPYEGIIIEDDNSLHSTKSD
jgi:hypothetical protein